MSVIQHIKTGFNGVLRLRDLWIVLFGFQFVGNFINSLINIGENPWGMSTNKILGTLVILAITSFILGGTLGHIRDYLETGKGQISLFLDRCMNYFLRNAGLLAIIALSQYTTIVLTSLIGSLTSPILSGIIGMTLLIVLLIFFSLSLYALSFRNNDIISAVRESFSLASHHFWGLFGLFLCLTVITFLVFFIASSILLGFGIFATPGLENRLLEAIILGAASSYTTLLSLTSYSSFYKEVAGGTQTYP